MRMLRGTAISYDWYKSAEGQGLLAHLTDPATGYRHDNIILDCFYNSPGDCDVNVVVTIRKVYGLLEQPSLPPSLPVHQFKLFLVRLASVVSVVVTRGLMTHDNVTILLHYFMTYNMTEV